MAGLVFWTWTPDGAFGREPVPAQQLLPFVDLELVGWDHSGKPTATTVKHQNTTMSEAKGVYQAIYKRLEITVLDYRGKPMPWLKKLPPKEIKTSQELKRTTVIDGFKALETYTSHNFEGELNINVADRFWVKVRGEGIDNTDPLKEVVQEMNLQKLATLAK